MTRRQERLTCLIRSGGSRYVIGRVNSLRVRQRQTMERRSFVRGNRLRVRSTTTARSFAHSGNKVRRHCHRKTHSARLSPRRSHSDDRKSRASLPKAHERRSQFQQGRLATNERSKAYTNVGFPQTCGSSSRARAAIRALAKPPTA